MKKELLKVITGDSSFDRDLLQQMLDENRKAQEDVEEAIRNAAFVAEKESSRIRLLNTRLKDIRDWGERFDFMTIDEQRAVLNQLIERIDSQPCS